MNSRREMLIKLYEVIAELKARLIFLDDTMARGYTTDWLYRAQRAVRLLENAGRYVTAGDSPVAVAAATLESGEACKWA